jgi:hypothetical protein
VDTDAITITFGPFCEKQRLAINRVEAVINKPPAEVMKTNGGASGLLKKLEKGGKSKTYQRNLRTELQSSYEHCSARACS